MPPTVVQAAPELSKILAGHPKVAAKAAPQGQKTKYLSSKPGSTTTREFELPEDEVIRRQLAQVKAERQGLLGALISLKNEVGKKKELEGESLAIQMLMIPGPSETEDAATATLAALEATQSEITSLQAARTAAAAAEAKARRDQAQASAALLEATRLQEAASQDEATLVQAVHDTSIAREAAEQALHKAATMSEQVLTDWHKKVKERAKEEAKERLLRESSLASDQREAPSDGSQAAARRFPPPAPLDILEGQWNRLHAATGALHPDGVIAFWQELKAKEEAMKELAALADVQDGEVRAALEEGRAAHAAELQLQRQASRASEIGGLGGAELLVHAASEKLLRKGFRRSTHVGPPWLASAADALALSVSKKNGPTLTAKARGRLVGVMGEPDVIDDTVFELNSYSSDDDWIIDKEYLKLRAAKLTGSRGRKGAPRADLKDSGTTHGIPGLMLPC
ncbi:hypothetical protein F751_3387 [Auxenochlorella protothecoides]|uniref:Uncharacterized protein n=1 Tax=Auxenochlorella protothecoides TaxID=3075 RepID=A0A087SBU2_AUXPR|nr:hypothetical protein F751_3387 [Auxenochlorella protothecoides]KFM23196.1 hypothetical protein F751_3387 [Auxenochlorella protothecoides]